MPLPKGAVRSTRTSARSCRIDSWLQPGFIRGVSAQRLVLHLELILSEYFAIPVERRRWDAFREYEHVDKLHGPHDRAEFELHADESFDRICRNPIPHDALEDDLSESLRKWVR
jgi:hypothetical protein